MSVIDRAQTPVLMFTGKGGVGKSTVATAWALACAERGLRTLLVDFDGRSSCAETFGRARFAAERERVAPGLDAIALDPKVALDEYLKQNGQGRLARRLGATGILDIVSSAVPGMREILMLGRVKSFERSGEYDRIVIDGYAAGHTLRLMSSPQGFLDAVKVGPIRQQAMEAHELLADPTRSAAALVSLPQITPLLELQELEAVLRGAHTVTIDVVVINECHTDPGPVPTRKNIRSALSVGERIPTEECVEAAHVVWAAEHDRASAEMAARETLPSDHTVVELPHITGDIDAVVRQMAEALR